MKKEIVLGIDIGGTYTKLGLVDVSGSILSTRKLKTGAKQSYSEFLQLLKTEVDDLKIGLKFEQKLVGIGVGAPNANMNTGAMENPPNFRWGSSIPVRRSLGELFNLPITIANDANAAALGEMEFGMGKGMKNFDVLTLGTGLGSGIILDGKLLIGHNGMVGEIGHVNVNSSPNA